MKKENVIVVVLMYLRKKFAKSVIYVKNVVIANRNKELFVLPKTGFGEFDDRFNSYYDWAEDELRKTNPHWVDSDGNIKEEYQDDCIGQACELAQEYLFDYLELLGYEIVHTLEED